MVVALGVANSIYAAAGYDAAATVDFAVRHGLACVQVYVPRPLAADEADGLGRACADAGLRPLCHWPDRLGPRLARDADLLAWTKRFYAHSPGVERAVVLHFDGALPAAVTGASLEAVAQAGLVPYLENTFHSAEAEASEACLETLIAVLEGGARRGLPCGVVIDVPRFWCRANGPVARAMARLERLAAAAAGAGLGAILHLVDVTDHVQARGTWAVMGEGILPWAAIGEVLAASGLTVTAAVLEHEDPEQAAASLLPCRRWLAALEGRRPPRGDDRST